MVTTTTNQQTEQAEGKGVQVPIGAHVFEADGGDGVVVDARPDLCIYRDADGGEHAAQWGDVMVKAAGPAEAAEATQTPATGDRLAGLLEGITADLQRLRGRIEASRLLVNDLDDDDPDNYFNFNKMGADLDGIEDAIASAARHRRWHLTQRAVLAAEGFDLSD